MAIGTAVLGIASTADFYAVDSDGASVTLDGSPTWSILDDSSEVVVSGTGSQDLSVANHWSTVFTLPTNIPVTDDLLYTIVWSATSESGTAVLFTEQFKVANVIEVGADEPGVLVLQGHRFTDFIETEAPLDEYTVSITDVNNNVLYTTTSDSSPVGSVVNSKYHYRVRVPIVSKLTAAGAGLFNYSIIWEMVYPTGPSSMEVHQLYVITPRTMSIISNLRLLLDKARNRDINVNLRWTDTELAAFIAMGIQRINGAPPQFTNWTIESVPKQLTDLVLKAAEYEAFNSLYLAEGMAAFDFQGQAVSLSVDRTKYIDTLRKDLGDWLTNAIYQAKRLYAFSEGPGALSIGVSTCTNIPIRVSNSIMAARLSRLYVG